jgi:hypothetical protein
MGSLVKYHNNRTDEVREVTLVRAGDAHEIDRADGLSGASLRVGVCPCSSTERYMLNMSRRPAGAT